MDSRERQVRQDRQKALLDAKLNYEKSRLEARKIEDEIYQADDMAYEKAEQLQIEFKLLQAKHRKVKEANKRLNKELVAV